MPSSFTKLRAESPSVMISTVMDTKKHDRTSNSSSVQNLSDQMAQLSSASNCPKEECPSDRLSKWQHKLNPTYEDSNGMTKQSSSGSDAGSDKSTSGSSKSKGKSSKSLLPYNVTAKKMVSIDAFGQI